MTTAKSVVIITGASRGLGAALAAHFLQDKNWEVVGVSRHLPEPSDAQHDSERKHFVVLGDVSDPETAVRAFDQAELLGTPKLLINSAGAATFGSAGSYTKSDVEVNFAAGLVGTILVTEEALRRYRSSGITIVNVMSTAAHVGRANEAVYCASKWGARGYTESLRIELKGTPNRVIGVYPGGMRTKFWNAKGAENVDPIKFMNPEEVASAIYSAIQSKPNFYISDIILNRG
jgi:NAD(P)-dependent dehydrogenase (short-subunit alcohol dehydrogenase family)